VLSSSLGYVVGRRNGRIHLANNRWLWTVTTRGGRILWDRALEGACGRGLVADDALNIPQSGTILQLDPATGAERAKIEVDTPDSEPVGNLLAAINDEILVANAARIVALKPRPARSGKQATPEGQQP
jgi:hypothetical protein